MGTLITMAVVAICLIIFFAYFAGKFGSRSGGNDNVWKPPSDEVRDLNSPDDRHMIKD